MSASRRFPLRARALAEPLLLFGALFLTLLVATGFVTALVERVRSRVDLFTNSQRPPDGEHYLARDSRGYVDHHVHMFGTDPELVQRMRDADVLFVGNSRILYALRPDVARPYFGSRQLRYYMLGFGFKEADAFPYTLILKWDLRPRLVVVNVDGFFGGGFSDWADVVMRDTPFAARKFQWESEIGHDVRTWFEPVLPNWLTIFGAPGMNVRPGITTYRSRRDGTFALTPWPEAAGFRAPADNGASPGRRELDAAERFKDELERRGARLVLTRVPAPFTFGGASPTAFAKALGVPLVMAEPPALTSSDGSHLSEASAHDWSRLFLDELDPVLREMALESDDR